MTSPSTKLRRIARRRREALAHDRPPASRPEAIRRRRRRSRPPRILVAPDRVWLVARTRPRWSARAARDLAEAGLATFEAREEVERVEPNGRRRIVREPLLRRLIFVGVRDDAELRRVEAHPGVEQVLFREGRAVVIPPAMLQAFADALTGHTGEGEAEAVAALLFALGDAVRVTEGPLARLPGIVEAVDPHRRRYRVAVEMFGRATPVDLDEDQIERR
ncbi:transcription termination/antitermination protein NusG [Methylobacterium nodulans]|uniref:Transcription termination/antitermination protein NusG n=1 Tax=Methylobacterium nodulans (strain LMG 21967 / CNCM I-2342 / ORS 2060) TaxID=460265 RepID=B8IDF9_METNO|nr:transcription termination/antitermination NusG family protein [Methylobacterium nodulans]ACL61325.1 NusG antitermination factor [Methylobacterium nodulans ORS 2060]